MFLTSVAAAISDIWPQSYIWNGWSYTCQKHWIHFYRTEFKFKNLSGSYDLITPFSGFYVILGLGLLGSTHLASLNFEVSVCSSLEIWKLKGHLRQGLDIAQIVTFAWDGRQQLYNVNSLICRCCVNAHCSFLHSHQLHWKWQGLPRFSG